MRSTLRLFLLCFTVANIGSAAGDQWTNIGPDGGSITALAVHPNDPRTIFAGVSGDGLYKSTDKGASWKLLTRQSLLYLQIDRDSPTTMYAKYNSEILKTSDGGATWKSVQPVDGDAYIETLVLNPGATNVIYAGIWHDDPAKVGVYRSSDAGVSWLRTNGGLPSKLSTVSIIAIDPSSNTTLYAAVLYDDEVTAAFTWSLFKSVDGGSTWSAINLPLLPSGSRLTQIGSLIVSPSSLHTVYTGLRWYDGEQSHGGAFASYDGGASWQRLKSGLPTMEYTPTIAAHPANPSLLFLTTDWSVYRSTNAGATWAPVDGFPSAGIWAWTDILAFDGATPGRMYIGTTSYGLYVSTNAGQTWLPSNAGIRGHVSTTSVAVSPKAPSTVYAAVYPSGIKRSIDGGTTWTPRGSGLPTDTIYSLVLDSKNPSVLYAGTNSRGVYKSIDGGLTWHSKNKGFDWKQFISKVVVDPTTPNTVYLASDAGVIKSTDGGERWKGLSAWSPATTLAIDPNTPSTLYAGGTGLPVVRKSVDGGKTWQDCQLPLTDKYSHFLSSLVVDPASTVTIYATVYYEGVFKSTDGGVSWEKSSSGLPKGKQEPRVRALWLDPDRPSTLYAGMGGYGQNGVWVSMNGGKNWVPANSGLPSYRYVWSLAASPTAPDAVYAGIWGQGIFRRTLTTTAAQDSGGSAP